MIRALPKPRKTVKLDVSLAIVNIVLLMILFFLATGQLMHPQTDDVAVAKTREAPLSALPSPVLTIASDGALALDGAAVAAPLLPAALSALPQPVTLHILIDGQAPATDLLSVIEDPGLANVDLRLVTLRQADPET